MLYREFWNKLHRREDECCANGVHRFAITQEIIGRHDRKFDDREEPLDFQLGVRNVTAFLGAAECDCGILRMMRPCKELNREWKETLVHRRNGKGKCRCARCVTER